MVDSPACEGRARFRSRTVDGLRDGFHLKSPMILSRARCKAISRLFFGVLLFAQFAVASYACPGLKGVEPMPIGNATDVRAASAVNASSAARPVAMPPGCDQLDPDAANLCAEHCRQGQQSVDTASVPFVSLGIPTFLYSIPLEPQHSLGRGRSFPAADARLAAAPEPPHAILHCVFRI